MKQELFVGGYGTFLGYSNGALVVRIKESKNEQVSFSAVSHVIFQGEGISISNAALIACANKNIPVFIFDNLGRVRAIVSSPAFYKDHQWEERQHAFLQSPRAVPFVIDLLRLKEQRQHAASQYQVRSLTRSQKVAWPSKNHERQEKIAHPRAKAATSLAEMRETLFLAEARSSRRYWSTGL